MNIDAGQERFSPATTKDLPRLQALARDIIRTQYAAFLGTEATEAYVASGQSDREIAEDLKTCMVLFIDNDPIGFAITREACIHVLMIARTWQRQGYGARLLRRVEQRLFREYPVLTLQSFRANEAANAFYLKHGWTVAGLETGDGPGMERLLFSKAENL